MALGHDDVGALVLEAAEHRVLDRRLVGRERVDLDDPAVPVRLVRLGGEVEALLDGVPVAARPARADAVAGVLLGVARVELAGGLEVLVEVLLARQRGAPGRHAAGAVVERAEHPGAGRVLRRLEPVVTRRRTGDLELGAVVDAPVVLGLLQVRDGAPRPGDHAATQLHDRHAVVGQADLGDLGVGVGVAREHDLLVGVLVVDHEQHPVLVVLPVVPQLVHAHVVAVVAELHPRGLGGLRVGVEVRGAVDDGVTPAHDDLVVEAGRGDHRVATVRTHGGEGDLRQVVGDPPLGGDGGARDRGRGQASEDQGTGPDGRALEDRAPGDGLGDLVTDVAGVGGVGLGVVAGVATAVEAGHPAAGAVHGRPGGGQREERAAIGERGLGHR